MYHKEISKTTEGWYKRFESTQLFFLNHRRIRHLEESYEELIADDNSTAWYDGEDQILREHEERIEVIKIKISMSLQQQWCNMQQ